MKKYYDVVVKEVFTSQGKEVTRWHQVGKLMETDQGEFFLNIPLLPKLYVFEQKAKNEAHKTAEEVSGNFKDDPF